MLTKPSRVTPSQRGGAATWILGLLVLAGVAFIVYWFVIRTPSAESSALAARVMPAEVELVGGVDIGRVLTDPDIRKAALSQGIDFARIESELQKAGVAMGDFEALVFGARLSDSALKDVIIAVQLKTDAKAAAGAVQVLLAMAPGQLRDVLSGGRVEALDGGVVLTGSGELLDKALAVAKGQGAALGKKPGLDEVRQGLDDGATFWTAAPVPADALERLPGMLSNMLGGTPSHFGFSATLGASSELRGALHIPGADASKVVSVLETALSFGKSRLGKVERAIADNLKLSSDGPTLFASVVLSQAQLDDILKRSEPSPE